MVADICDVRVRAVDHRRGLRAVDTRTASATASGMCSISTLLSDAGGPDSAVTNSHHAALSANFCTRRGWQQAPAPGHPAVAATTSAGDSLERDVPASDAVEAVVTVGALFYEGRLRDGLDRPPRGTIISTFARRLRGR